MTDKINLPLQLSSIQKYILIVAQITDNPAAAFNMLNNTPNVIEACKILNAMGLVELNKEGITLTPEGNNILVNNNLVDENGQLTANANDIISKYKITPPTTSTPTENPVGEKFTLLKQLL